MNEQVKEITNRDTDFAKLYTDVCKIWICNMGKYAKNTR